MTRARNTASPLLSEYRRPTETWIRVNKRRLHEIGFTANVSRGGEPRRGAVVLMIQDGVGRWRIFSQARAADGSPIWLEALAGRAAVESEAQSYARRSIERDPDIWILEIRQSDPLVRANTPGSITWKTLISASV